MARGDIRRQSSASRRSALACQNPPFIYNSLLKKYPITSVCRPATGSMSAFDPRTDMMRLRCDVRCSPDFVAKVFLHD
jgi:hypothetical protein